MWKFRVIFRWLSVRVTTCASISILKSEVFVFLTSNLTLSNSESFVVSTSSLWSMLEISFNFKITIAVYVFVFSSTYCLCFRYYWFRVIDFENSCHYHICHTFSKYIAIRPVRHHSIFSLALLITTPTLTIFVNHSEEFKFITSFPALIMCKS